MPAKKRTETKRTPPASPLTSTSHASADQHHRLRHTGPSISTRSSISAGSSRPPPPPAHAHREPTPESSPTHKDSLEKKLLADVPPPGATRTSFTKFLYVLFFVMLLLFGWYLYGMVTLLEQLKEEVGWWGIVVGNPAASTPWGIFEGAGFGSSRPGRKGERAEAEKSGELERSLNALADVLGISPMQVASAVKLLIPQESLTSIALKPEETSGSEAVRILFEGITQDDGGKSEFD